MKRRKGQRDLAVTLTMWNLGTLVLLALAFGGALGATSWRIQQLDKKVTWIVYVLSGAMQQQKEHYVQPSLGSGIETGARTAEAEAEPTVPR